MYTIAYITENNTNFTLVSQTLVSQASLSQTSLSQMNLWDKALKNTQCILIDDSIAGYVDVITQIKQHATTSHIPIIFLYNTLEMLQRLIQAGIDDFIQHDDGRLCEKIILSIQRAKRTLDANPLTRLPGNRAIHTHIAAFPQDTIIHVDINNFKAYNDTHGFLEGDKIIQHVATIITSISHKAFVGHIGGDDFIVITIPPRANILIPKLKQALKKHIKTVSISVTPIPRNLHEKDNMCTIDRINI